MTLVLDHYSRSLRLLDVPDRTLHDEDLWGTNTIFVKCGSPGEERERYETAEEFEKTRFYAILDQFKNTIRVKVGLPSANEYEAVGFVSPFKVSFLVLERR